MSVHLATADGILCWTEGYLPPLRTESLASVSCIRCSKRLDDVKQKEDDAAWEHRRLDTYASAAETLGVGHLWLMVSDDRESPTRRMLRDILGATLVGLVEIEGEQA